MVESRIGPEGRPRSGRRSLTPARPSTVEPPTPGSSAFNSMRRLTPSSRSRSASRNRVWVMVDVVISCAHRPRVCEPGTRTQPPARLADVQRRNPLDDLLAVLCFLQLATPNPTQQRAFDLID